MYLIQFRFLLIIFSFSLLFSSGGCSSGSEKEGKEVMKIDEVAPENIRIIGEVTQILEEELSGKPGTPCAEIPCKAIVRIEKILKRGHSFISPLSPGDKVQVSFVFTTGKADKSLFPNSNVDLPGVKEGDKIQADMSGIVNTSTNEKKFSITDYKLIEGTNEN